MNRNTNALTDAELDRLGDFLGTLKGPRAMNLERVDGFFCGLLAGPELILPSEYWPVILGEQEGDAEPSFESLEQAQDIMSLLMRHWNAINATLRAGDIYMPILLEDGNGIAHGNDWAKGFLRAVEMRRFSWQAFLDDDEHAGSIVPMFALAHEDDPDPTLRFESPTPEKRDDLLKHMIAGLVKIYEYFAEARRTAAGPRPAPARRSSPKTGRNDPCPCGSGHKFKHCCYGRVH